MASGLYIHTKKEPSKLTRLIIFLILVATIGSGWLAYRWYTLGEIPPFISLPSSFIADTTIDESFISEQEKSKHNVGPRHPRFLSIPSINLDKARIQSVGMTNKNVLEMPGNIHDVGWYKKSSYPGQGYEVVLLDGHSYGSKSNGPFANLSELKEGETIIVERGDGKLFRYKVTDITQESSNVANTDGIKRLLQPVNDDKEALGIISPSGRWIPRDKIYSHRTMVRATAA